MFKQQLLEARAGGMFPSKYGPWGTDWTDTPVPKCHNLNNVCVTCHAVGFDFFCPPLSTLGRRKHVWNLGGAGDKVVQGLNILSIYGMLGMFASRRIETIFPEKNQLHVHVDGRNPAQVDMVNIPLFLGFHTCQVVSRISSINGLKPKQHTAVQKARY